MYVVFYGTDRELVRNKATEYINKNLPEGATLTTIEGSEYEPGFINDALGATSLFGGEEWFVIDLPSDGKDCEPEILESLEQLGQSRNTFVILEGGLLAAAKKKYAKFADSVEEFKSSTQERFNSFALAEALAGKDKRKLWLLLQEAKLSGLREEEIIGMLWWQLKALRLAKQTKSASEAGMKDFPYNKAKRSLVKFKDNEVEELAQSLLEIYHQGHAGLVELDLALETWVLKV